MTCIVPDSSSLFSTHLPGGLQSDDDTVTGVQQCLGLGHDGRNLQSQAGSTDGSDIPKKDIRRTGPIFRPVMFLVAPCIGWYVIRCRRSPYHHNHNDVWVSSSLRADDITCEGAAKAPRRPTHHNHTSMIVSHLLHTITHQLAEFFCYNKSSKVPFFVFS